MIVHHQAYHLPANRYQTGLNYARQSNRQRKVLGHTIYYPYVCRCIRICTCTYSLALAQATLSGLPSSPSPFHFPSLLLRPGFFFLFFLYFSKTSQTEACIPYPEPQSQVYWYNPAACTRTNPVAPCQSLHMPLFSSSLQHWVQMGPMHQSCLRRPGGRFQLSRFVCLVWFERRQRGRR